MSQKRSREMQKQKKIKKYRKPLNLNIGMIIFAAVFVYVTYFVIGYFKYSPPKPYEVKEGSLSTNTIFRGIALRDEEVVASPAAGYINYYVREGERVAKGDMVFSVDETGRLNEYMESIYQGDNSLSSSELLEFGRESEDFMHNFSPLDFSSVYDFKYTIQGTVLKLANEDMLAGLRENGSDLGTIQSCYAGKTGIVSYWVDGYEKLQTSEVTKELLQKKEISEEEAKNLEGEDPNDYYIRRQLLGTSLAEAGDPAYKLSLSENWSLIIPVEASYGEMLLEEEYVKVRFLKNQYESWAGVSLLTDNSGNTLAKLDFTNSMITFATDRFLEVELILDDETGLKIPNSSIAEREFFLIPKDFVTADEDGKVASVMRRTFLEDGSISAENIELDIYSEDEETNEYYLDTEVLGRGDVLIKLESQETYTVSKSATLIGVYNMNKGYADFREIQILAQNDEYAIVESNTRYGLNVYDNIVLNAESVDADQFIYE